MSSPTWSHLPWLLLGVVEQQAGYELTTKNGRSVCTDPIAVMQAQ